MQSSATSKVIALVIGITIVAVIAVGLVLLLPSGPEPIEPIEPVEPVEPVEPERPAPEPDVAPLEPPLLPGGEHPAAEDLRQRVEAYFVAFEAKDASEVLSFYTDSRDTFAEWSGQAGVFAGTYQGSGNIRILLATVMGNIIDIHIRISDYEATFDGDRADVSMKLVNTGHGKLIGEFDMEIDVTTIWEYTDGRWMILDDRWDFTLFKTEIVAEATVFPLNWRKRGDFSFWEKRIAQLFGPWGGR